MASTKPAGDAATLSVAGVALIALQCAGLIFVIAALAWFPESAQGIRLRTPQGLLVAALVLSGGLSCLGLVLGAMGFDVVQRKSPRSSCIRGLSSEQQDAG